ncbi:ABC transporter ATP-binding protein [Sulfurimonas autotrophica]|uniref:ABC transporter related protein n=1 Tax=Sulfurimonas autotrophica (strain ATCC BAA-671 / DSM 16294 / JCM 11897 / OK10) TaxID=563040 RepID=E0UU20_SULAO|nr:ABC transporter ATP-binding protein [Sulfurimonas autotrophica]ADN08329.1 ABC transporter related protein [Sulfurimonas autotrophica DSM 16294]
MNKNIAIKVQNLTKIYKLYKEPIDRLKEALNPLGKAHHKNFHALKDVSFEIKKGETVGIIGRNGSGKSTLLKIITGVLTPSAGRVNVHGKISAILELGAGFNPEMSGLENIYLNTSINGMSKKDTDKKIKEILEFAELGEFIHQPIKTYSSGMKARLGFAVAINIEPDLLIVDEALAVGDAAFQRKCFAKMEQIREAGTTILFVSHSEGSIVSLCSRAIWLSNGEKIIEGKPKLVTGLYMKNANKNMIDKAIIEAELQELEKKSEKKDKSKKKEVQKKAKHAIEEFYDPSLKPKSTIYYEEKGAKISDIKVTTLDGREVNVLIHGYNYIYSYVVNVKNKTEDVRFGFLIKNTLGVAIAGGSYSMREHQGIDIVPEGNYMIKFSFKCLFNEGEYFLNAGCSSFKKHIHRIVDTYAFKVMHIEKMICTSSVNCIDNCEVIRSD